MPAYWILKTEPSAYAFADLRRDGRTRWDGITNALALKHLRTMRRGDRVLVYHTGDEKRLVGLATISGDPYPDPSADDERTSVVDLEAGEPLATPVTLAQVKADPFFADFGLVRMSRLSVIPVSEAQWKRLLAMGGAPSR